MEPNNSQEEINDHVCEPDENTEESMSTPSTQIVRKSIFRSPKNNKKRQPQKPEQNRTEQAYNILQDAVKRQNVRDDSTIYGEYVASKHSKYSAHTKSVVEHLIANIFFNADMGKYENPNHKSYHPSYHQSSWHFDNSLSPSESYTLHENTIPIPSSPSQSVSFEAPSNTHTSCIKYTFLE